jgi:thiol-disulfide isomerase/thioredoxin
VSHSPLEFANVPTEDPYASGWNAVIRLARRGDSWSGGERNVCFLNLGADARGAAPHFVDVAGALGIDHPDDSRAAARIDLDLDGDEDLVVSGRTSPRVRLLANRVADGARHVGFDVVGTTSNRDGIGARVKVTPLAGLADDAAAVGPTQHKTRRAGEGYLAQSSATLRFGLGRPRSADVDVRAARVTVRWPGATSDEDFGVVGLERRYRLVQGRGRASEVAGQSAVTLPTGALPAEERVQEARRIVLTTPHAIPSLEVTARDGRVGRLFGATNAGPRGTGRATLVLVWASWCPPCLRELAAFEAAREELRAVGLDVIALGAEPEAEWPVAETALASLGWRGASVRASAGALEILDAVLEDVRFRPTRMPLPTAFLFDASGALAVVYVGGATPEAARLDMTLVSSPVDRRADLATPFPGQWRQRPDAGSDTRLLAPDTLLGRLGARGLESARRELELARATTVRSDSLETSLTIAEARMQQGTAEALTQALELFDQVLEQDAARAEALSGRARALSGLGRTEAAVAAWRAFVAAQPASPEGRVSLGMQLVAAGHLAAARTELEALRALGTPRATELAAQLAELIRNAEARQPHDPGR